MEKSFDSFLRLLYAEHKTAISDWLTNCFINEKYLDVTFVCKDNVCVQVHKVILLSVSEYLKQIICNCSDEMVFISLPDFDSSVVEIFVNYLYEGVTKVNVQELYCLGELLTVLKVHLINCEVKPVTSVPIKEAAVENQNAVSSVGLLAGNVETASFVQENNEIAPTPSKNKVLGSCNGEVLPNNSETDCASKLATDSKFSNSASYSESSTLNTDSGPETHEEIDCALDPLSIEHSLKVQPPYVVPKVESKADCFSNEADNTDFACLAGSANMPTENTAMTTDLLKEETENIFNKDKFVVENDRNNIEDKGNMKIINMDNVNNENEVIDLCSDDDYNNESDFMEYEDDCQSIASGQVGPTSDQHNDSAVTADESNQIFPEFLENNTMRYNQRDNVDVENVPWFCSKNVGNVIDENTINLTREQISAIHELDKQRKYMTRTRIQAAVHLSGISRREVNCVGFQKKNSLATQQGQDKNMINLSTEKIPAINELDKQRKNMTKGRIFAAVNASGISRREVNCEELQNKNSLVTQRGQDEKINLTKEKPSAINELDKQKKYKTKGRTHAAVNPSRISRPALNCVEFQIKDSFTQEGQGRKIYELTEEEISTLNEVFKKTKYLTPSLRSYLIRLLGVSSISLGCWFDLQRSMVRKAEIGNQESCSSFSSNQESQGTNVSGSFDSVTPAEKLDTSSKTMAEKEIDVNFIPLKKEYVDTSEENTDVYFHDRNKLDDASDNLSKVNCLSKKRENNIFTATQVKIMKDVYKNCKFPNQDTVKELAGSFKVPSESVNGWFVTQRMGGKSVISDQESCSSFSSNQQYQGIDISEGFDSVTPDEKLDPSNEMIMEKEIDVNFIPSTNVYVASLEENKDVYFHENNKLHNASGTIADEDSISSFSSNHQSQGVDVPGGFYSVILDEKRDISNEMIVEKEIDVNFVPSKKVYAATLEENRDADFHKNNKLDNAPGSSAFAALQEFCSSFTNKYDLQTIRNHKTSQHNPLKITETRTFQNNDAYFDNENTTDSIEEIMHDDQLLNATDAINAIVSHEKNKSDDNNIQIRADAVAVEIYNPVDNDITLLSHDDQQNSLINERSVVNKESLSHLISAIGNYMDETSSQAGKPNPKHIKTFGEREQSVLEKVYRERKYLDEESLVKLTMELGTSRIKLTTWFHLRRLKDRLDPYDVFNNVLPHNSENLNQEDEKANQGDYSCVTSTSEPINDTNVIVLSDDEQDNLVEQKVTMNYPNQQSPITKNYESPRKGERRLSSEMECFQNSAENLNRSKRRKTADVYPVSLQSSVTVGQMISQSVEEIDSQTKLQRTSYENPLSAVPLIGNVSSLSKETSSHIGKDVHHEESEMQQENSKVNDSQLHEEMPVVSQENVCNKVAERIEKLRKLINNNSKNSNTKHLEDHSSGYICKSNEAERVKGCRENLNPVQKSPESISGVATNANVSAPIIGTGDTLINYDSFNAVLPHNSENVKQENEKSDHEDDNCDLSTAKPVNYSNIMVLSDDVQDNVVERMDTMNDSNLEPPITKIFADRLEKLKKLLNSNSEKSNMKQLDDHSSGYSSKSNEAERVKRCSENLIPVQKSPNSISGIATDANVSAPILETGNTSINYDSFNAVLPHNSENVKQENETANQEDYSYVMSTSEPLNDANVIVLSDDEQDKVEQMVTMNNSNLQPPITNIFADRLEKLKKLLNSNSENSNTKQLEDHSSGYISKSNKAERVKGCSENLNTVQESPESISDVATNANVSAPILETGDTLINYDPFNAVLPHNLENVKQENEKANHEDDNCVMSTSESINDTNEMVLSDNVQDNVVERMVTMNDPNLQPPIKNIFADRLEKLKKLLNSNSEKSNMKQPEDHSSGYVPESNEAERVKSFDLNFIPSKKSPESISVVATNANVSAPIIETGDTLFNCDPFNAVLPHNSENVKLENEKANHEDDNCDLSMAKPVDFTNIMISDDVQDNLVKRMVTMNYSNLQSPITKNNKRTRVFISREQKSVLEEVYKREKYLSNDVRDILVETLQLSRSKLTNWFGWRRYKDQLAQGSTNSQCKKKRKFLSESQWLKLKEVYENSKYISDEDSQKLSQSLGISTSTVKKWFCKERYKEKTMPSGNTPVQGQSSSLTNIEEPQYIDSSSDDCVEEISTSNDVCEEVGFTSSQVEDSFQTNWCTSDAVSVQSGITSVQGQSSLFTNIEEPQYIDSSSSDDCVEELSTSNDTCEEVGFTSSQVENSFKTNWCISDAVSGVEEFFSLVAADKGNTEEHHALKRYKCDICEKMFTRLRNMREHVASFHNNIRYECNYCHNIFSRKGSLRAHIKVVHKKIKKYTCQVCYNCFAHPNHLRKHFKTHLKNTN